MYTCILIPQNNARVISNGKQHRGLAEHPPHSAILQKPRTLASNQLEPMAIVRRAESTNEWFSLLGPSGFAVSIVSSLKLGYNCGNWGNVLISLDTQHFPASLVLVPQDSIVGGLFYISSWHASFAYALPPFFLLPHPSSSVVHI